MQKISQWFKVGAEWSDFKFNIFIRIQLYSKKFNQLELQLFIYSIPPTPIKYPPLEIRNDFVANSSDSFGFKIVVTL
jgi:hypothetical protein